MTEGPVFNEPKLAINRVYTRHGDAGTTRLVGGQEVKKHDLRIEAYGTVDELNAIVGAARTTLEATLGAKGARRKKDLRALDATLLRVQHELFNLGSILATLPEDQHPKQPRVTDVEIARLEEEMDACGERLEPLRSFVLPGGSRLNTDLHLARTVCRRAERHATALAERDPSGVDPTAIRYLNRLSDAFFVWSRWAAYLARTPEVLWAPNRAASAERSAEATERTPSKKRRGRRRG